MKKKPTSRRYRNLVARGSVIYYERVENGRRVRLSAKTADWDEAASFRDLYEEDKKSTLEEAPDFTAFSARYVREDTSHLARTTRSDLDSYLREGGPLIGFFGNHRLDEITVPLLREWWNREVTLAGRSVRTG